MKKNHLKRYSCLLLISFLFFSGCAYYNTFFNAKQRYNDAFKKQNATKSETLPGDVQKNYRASIQKCWKLIDTYGDSSDWADDALLLIGKSHYNLTEYIKSERVLEQFNLKYYSSILIPESKLWLAKSKIALKKDDEALAILDKLFNTEISVDIAGQVFYILGDLNYQREEYEKAIKNLEKCVEASRDDETLGLAHYLMGEIYFILKQYEEAIPHFKELTGLEIPVLKEFDANTKQVESYIELERYLEAENLLKNMLRDIRFKKQFSLIETKLSNLSEIQGDVDFALDYYYEIRRKYKNDEGVSLSAFYIAQLYEFEFFKWDSAEFYYNKVKNLKDYREVEEQAKSRASLLKEYLKIRTQIRKDKQDIYALAKGDSTLQDSLEVEPDLTNNDTETENHNEPITQSIESENVETVLKDSTQIKAVAPKKKIKKVAITRTPEQVHQSYVKNSFALGEYFLIKYQDYDSSEVAFSDFIVNFPDDSLLTPKSFYALYFIADKFKPDSLKADSLKKIIISRYPESVYGQKIIGDGSNVNIPVAHSIRENNNFYQQFYSEAEFLIDNQKYEMAIELFTKIAVQDSGSQLAEKSRYAIAYVYENYLDDIPKAVEAYTLLNSEYKGTKYTKVAQIKIKEPPKNDLVETPENVIEENAIEEVRPERELKVAVPDSGKVELQLSPKDILEADEKPDKVTGKKEIIK